MARTETEKFRLAGIKNQNRCLSLRCGVLYLFKKIENPALNHYLYIYKFQLKILLFLFYTSIFLIE